MSIERRITARGIIFMDGKLFVQKLKHTDGETNVFWSTPGGKLDPAEDIRAGLVRELIEETGVTAEVGRLLFVQQFYKEGDSEFVEFFFLVENPQDFLNINLHGTTHGHLEVAEFGFVDPQKEHVLPAFLSDIDLESYIETVRPVYFYAELGES